MSILGEEKSEVIVSIYCLYFGLFINIRVLSACSCYYGASSSCTVREIRLVLSDANDDDDDERTNRQTGRQNAFAAAWSSQQSQPCALPLNTASVHSAASAAKFFVDDGDGDGGQRFCERQQQLLTEPNSGIAVTAALAAAGALLKHKHAATCKVPIDS